jgi:hypothetical protein
MSVTGFIFSIETVRIPKGVIFRLKVNFTPEIIMLTKEVFVLIDHLFFDIILFS